MLRLITAQLPYWARPNNPVLRYELGKLQSPSLRVRLLRSLGIVVIGIIVVIAGYFIAVHDLNQRQQTLDTLPLTLQAMSVLYVPALAVQILLQIGALLLTAGTVDEERRRQTWDNLRATESGAAMTFRARWASVFYRLRGLLGIVLLIRVAFIFGILYDLTAFRGAYLDRLINGITPEVSLVLAVPLVAFFMAATLLLPLTGLGFDASVGLLFSTLVRQRTYNVILQILALALRVAVVIVLAVLLHQFLNGEITDSNPVGSFLQNSDAGGWVILLGNGIFGDWGLRMLQLGTYSEVWATVPYAILFGVVLLLVALVQAFLADIILSLAIRRAEKRE